MADAATPLPSSPEPAAAPGLADFQQQVAALTEAVRAAGVELPGSPACPKPLRHGSLIIGGDTPTIAVATTASTPLEAAHQAVAAARAGADLVEFRLDLIEELPWPRANYHIGQWAQAAGRWFGQMNRALSKAGFSQFPVLLTLRREQEGGRAALWADGFRDVYHSMIHDLSYRVYRRPALIGIDVEESSGCLASLVNTFDFNETVAVASAHYFDRTPAEDEILAQLRRMEEQGAAVTKIAVMPHSFDDVVTLARACASARVELQIPVIAIAMGELGAVTRLAGGLFGSALTFATAGSGQSAPGQLDIKTVRRGLATLH